MRNLKRCLILAISVTIATPLAGPANADDPVTSGDIMAAVQDAEGMADPIPFAVDESAQLSATTGSVEVDVSKDPSGSVVLSDVATQASFGFDLPEMSNQSDARVAEDGTVTYADPSGLVGMAIRATANGVQILNVIGGPDSPTEYSYALDLPSGSGLARTEDGGYVLVNSPGDPYARIEAPWATDADGDPVPTHYEQRGNRLIQIIDHQRDNIAYPVVADPKVSVGWFAYVHFNHAETRTIKNGGWGAAGGATACAAAGMALAGPGGAAAMGAACLAQLGAIVYVAGVADNSSPRKCLYLKWRPGTPVVPGSYKDARCT